MASKEEMEAMGIEVKQCKECCRDISKEEYDKNKGYCKNCYEEKENIKSEKAKYNNTQKETKFITPTNNKVAIIIKTIAVIVGVAGIIYGCTMFDSSYTEEIGVVYIIVSIISAVFVYALGEIIQKLQNIEDNTRK